jgi:hypothetical protein
MDQIKDFEKPSSASAATTLSTIDDGDDSESEWLGTEDEALQARAYVPAKLHLESANPEASRERFVDCDEEDVPKKFIGGMRRKVSWGNIEMHLHPVIAGDHPDTIEGPPVGDKTKLFSLEISFSHHVY